MTCFASKRVAFKLFPFAFIPRGPFFGSRSNLIPVTLHCTVQGVNTFSTGAFAPGVTVNYATYKMWAADYGIKWNGLAVNGQYFTRRLKAV